MTNEFTDTEGRTWRLSIVVADLKRVREGTAIELGKLIEKKMAGLVALLDDPEKFVDVLWVMIEPQAVAQGLTPPLFGAAMGGDSLESAVTAFVGALADFSPRPTRTLLMDWLKKSKETEDKFIAFGRAKMGTMNPEAEWEKAWSESAGNSPESLGSTLSL